MKKTGSGSGSGPGGSGSEKVRKITSFYRDLDVIFDVFWRVVFLLKKRDLSRIALTLKRFHGFWRVGSILEVPGTGQNGKKVVFRRCEIHGTEKTTKNKKNQKNLNKTKKRTSHKSHACRTDFHIRRKQTKNKQKPCGKVEGKK